MKEMYLVEIKRISRQKFIWFFLFAFVVAAYAYSFLITALDLREMLNVDPAEAGGARFPQFMSNFYAITVGPLFMTFITALYMNEDNLAGMLKQPLLHAKTRKDILNSKFISLCGLNVFIMIAIYIIVYVVGFLNWGSEVFAMPIFMITLQKYILITISLTVMEALTIMISLYAPNTVILIGVMLGVILVDNFVCNQFESFSNLFLFNYSTIYYLKMLDGNIDIFFMLKGIVYDVLYFILFYHIAAKRIERLEIR